MNILMIFSPVTTEYDDQGMHSAPPMALYALTAVLEQHGHRVTAVDPHLVKQRSFFAGGLPAQQFLDDLFADRFDVIGFSTNTGNWAMTRQMIFSLRQKAPHTPIVVGGVHPSYFDEHVLRTTPADIVVRGEGEVTFPRLLQALSRTEPLEGVSGITYRNAAGAVVRNPDAPKLTAEELALLPFPALDRVPAGVYGLLPLETSRGCRFNCRFCSVVHRRSWRPWPVELTVQRVLQAERLVKGGLTRSNVVYLVDDCFSADPERALAILHRLQDEGCGLKFILECRVTDLIQPRFIERIPKPLIQFVQIGVEAGYDEGLRRIRKGITTAQLDKCVQLLSEHDMIGMAFLSFMIGFPWETQEDCLKTVHTAARMSSVYGIMSNLNWLWLCPSDLWVERSQYGIELDESVFDDPLWLVKPEVFTRAHPLVTAQVFRTVESTIAAYQAAGVPLQHVAFARAGAWSA